MKRKRYGRRDGFRWSKTVGAWIRYHTRDHKADTWSIDRLSLALRLELGLKACRVIDNATRRERNVDSEAFTVGTTSRTTARTPLLNSWLRE
ncbi:MULTISPECIES: hypothetical protein [Streptomyces]|uniref:hypothetical protein n=1 Tax=Streptomyces TaxID=1883 RepID=UPI0036D3ED25